VGERVQRLDQEFFQGLLAPLGLLHLGHPLLHERLDELALQAGDRGLGGRVNLLGPLWIEVSNLLQRREAGPSDPRWSGILVQQGKHIGGPNVRHDLGQFRKRARQQVVQSIDCLRDRFHLRLEPPDDLPQHA
jgi:hypothetical protein